MAKIISVPPSRATSDYKVKAARSHLATAEDVQDPCPDRELVVDRGGEDYVYGVFTKTMEHNSFGEVKKSDFEALERAMATGMQADFDAIPEHPSNVRGLVNPQAALSYVLCGQDNQSMTMPTSPSITSEQSAGEMMEVYEMAMHRDIPFNTIDAGTDPATVRAINTLNNYGADFKGPKDGGVVTGKTLFRGVGQDETVGPYISQMLYLPFDYGNLSITQQYKEENDTASSTSLAGWLDIQNGTSYPAPNFSGMTNFIHTPRMMGSYVHNDALFQAYFNGALVMLQNGVPMDPNIPVLPREEFFVGLGPVDVFTAVACAAKVGLQAAWHHKWVINLRLRPEVMAGRIHFQQTTEDYGIDPSSNGAATIAAMINYNNTKWSNTTALLPLMFPEGSPTHPEYPAGHAVAAGACATMLKAFFDTSKTWVGDLGLTPQHSLTGSSLTVYTGGDASQMTVLGEINKLASNVALGRNMAGVHYRSAGDYGIALGEKVAIALLKDFKETYNEDFEGWNLTKLDGEEIVI